LEILRAQLSERRRLHASSHVESDL
jgi:hypothetical protein